MGPTNPLSNSPRRKRNQPSASHLLPSPLRLTTESSLHMPLEEEGAAAESPRTKIVSHFEGLQLGGGGVSKLNLKRGSPQPPATMKAVDGARKRRKTVDDHELEIPETPQSAVSVPRSQSPAKPFVGVGPVTFEGRPGNKDPQPKLAESFPSIDPLMDAQSRSRQQLSPPPSLDSGGNPATDAEVATVGPTQSALTWHDNEITGHDPDDPDDDGEGLNGIGFKPTPAQAEVRSRRRKQQLAEYRSRESKEARAKRTQRRRGGRPSSKDTVIKEAERARRVRFTEREGNSMIKTA